MFIYLLGEFAYYKSQKKKNQLSEIISFFEKAYLYFLKDDILNSNDRCSVLSHK